MITEEMDIALVRQAIQPYFQTGFEIKRTTSGLSTYVYQIAQGGQTYYLRVLPEKSSFAAEAKAHALMRMQHIHVPDVLFYEHENLLLGKSLMLTSEIPGTCIDHGESQIPSILFEAGKQLALINRIPVDGFGWIDRNSYETLKGEKRTFHDYYYEGLDAKTQALRAYGFEPAILRKWLDQAYLLLDTTRPVLVHGDFDNTHIYHAHGRYTGIIDFGEIRGSHFLYDLGHYKLHDEEGHFPHLAEGYRAIQPLTPDDAMKIDLLALFIAVGRSQYGVYRKLLDRQLEIITSSY